MQILLLIAIFRLKYERTVYNFLGRCFSLQLALSFFSKAVEMPLTIRDLCFPDKKSGNFFLIKNQDTKATFVLKAGLEICFLRK